MSYSNASRFPRPDIVGLSKCCWRGCRQPQAHSVPVCFAHALIISDLVRDALGAVDPDAEPLEQTQPQPFVYYLMIGPTTVKIGTTRNLRQRLNGLRTDVQYVVAIERGDFKVEHERHRQFSDERIGRREDFKLSERLKRHIEELQPHRDVLVSVATTYPLSKAG